MVRVTPEPLTKAQERDRKIVRGWRAADAFAFAVDVAEAEEPIKTWGGESWDEPKVREVFGEGAVKAWLDAKEARARFFREVG